MADAERWSEAEYNRLLRMCDPRMLTPHPFPHLAGVFGASPLAPAIRAIAECTVAGPDAADGTCDLVVALDPSRDTLVKMRRALRPGGVCYCVWPSAHALRAGALAERVSAAGFGRAITLVPWPLDLSLRRRERLPRAWLPVGEARPLRWMAARHPAGRGGLPGPLQQLRRSNIVDRLAFRLASPVHVIAFQADAAAEADLAPFVQDERTWALLSEGAHSSNKVVALGFVVDRVEPALVVKMPRVRGVHRGLEQEWSILTRLGELAEADLPGVPQVLDYRNAGGLAQLTVTALPGTPMMSVLRSATASRLARSGTAWLTTFALRTINLDHRQTTGDEINRIVRAFDTTFTPTLGTRVADACRVVGERLADLPTVAEHRDFAPWNLLVGDDGALGVVDWESAVLDGLPGCDLFYYLLHVFHLASLSRAGDIVATGRLMRDNATRIGRASAAYVAGYFTALGLDPCLEQPLRLAAWMVHAVSVQRRYDAAGMAEGRRVNPFLELWKHELDGLSGDA